ncbi:MAG: putative toxin-antitoxin system toxin component, PIN family [Burkholderiaceae bacterium]
MVLREGAPRLLVLDTNIVLDLLVFSDPSVGALRKALEAENVRWLASAAMRDELARVLDYPRIAARVDSTGSTSAEILAQYQRLSQRAEAAALSVVRCSDRDDQIFVDLAVKHGACLLSKDHAVLRLRKRLEKLGVMVQNAWHPT